MFELHLKEVTVVGPMNGQIELLIKGMTCSGCTEAVSRAIRKVPGVTDVSVELEAGRARVAGTATHKDLAAAVETAGFDIVHGQDPAASSAVRKGGCCCG